MASKATRDPAPGFPSDFLSSPAHSLWLAFLKMTNMILPQGLCTCLQVYKAPLLSFLGLYSEVATTKSPSPTHLWPFTLAISTFLSSFTFLHGIRCHNSTLYMCVSFFLCIYSLSISQHGIISSRRAENLLHFCCPSNTFDVWHIVGAQ